MHEQTIDMTSTRVRQQLSMAEILVRTIEKTKLRLRAGKYLHKEDTAGVQYISRQVTKNSIVFDIGAHKGGYLYHFLRQLHQSGHVYAFEPQSVLYTYLSKLKTLLHWNNITVEPFAISEKNGIASLCVPHNHGRPSSPCATIIESRMPFHFQFSEQVRTVTIDEYCRIHTIVPDFLKVDVEGNELPVFRGAKNILEKYRPRILFECEARFVGEERVTETFRFLSGIGYTGYFIHGRDIRPIGEFDVLQHQSLSAGTYCNNFIFE